MSILNSTYLPPSSSSRGASDLYSNGNFSYGALSPNNSKRTNAALARYLDYNYNSPYIDQSIKLAPSKRRSLSNQGGLLNRMFGNSGSNDQSPKPDSPTSPSKPSSLSLVTEEPHVGLQKRNSVSGATSRKKDDDSPAGEKKRRSSSVANAFSKARNSLHLSSSHNSGSGNDSKAETPLQKLGKTDPALAVPHGPNNNSAGESMPTSRSSFRVGVTEDKNKKCRRAMEDTHSYLYNFLGTPAPSLPIESSSNSKKSLDLKDTDADSNSDMSTHVVETDNGYFAIFDGHAGTFAADWCGKKLHVILEECIRKNPNMAIPELLDMTYTTVDQQLEKLPLKNSGCTAITAVLRWEDRVPNSQSATGSSAVAPQTALAMKAMTDGKAESTENAETPTQTTPVVAKAAAAPNPAAAATTLQEQACRQRVLYTANVGDARIVLCRNGKALRLSYDHKGSDENEGKRIANAGGLILNNRVNGVLAVTRALGDAYLKDLVTGHPYTTETVIQPDIDEFLILACDGLWDVCSDQEAVDLIRHTQDPQVASKQLVDHALARFSTDNLSCMVIRFDTRALQSHAAHKAPPIGVEGDAPFKKRGGISEVDALVKEARKSIKKDKDGPAMETVSTKESQESKESRESKEKLTEEIIKEEEEEEPGPELTPEGAKDVPPSATAAKAAAEMATKKK